MLPCKQDSACGPQQLYPLLVANSIAQHTQPTATWLPCVATAESIQHAEPAVRSNAARMVVLHVLLCSKGKSCVTHRGHGSYATRALV